MPVSKLKIAFSIISAYLLSTFAFAITLALVTLIQGILPPILIIATFLKWTVLFLPYIVKIAVIVFVIDKIIGNDSDCAYVVKIYFIAGIIVHSIWLVLSIFPEFDSYAFTTQILYIITSIFPLYAAYKQ